ncbi:hypothetical protein JM18_001364 [Phytophthora kernoviae]|uniref:Nonsense-mediated mRNA decay factor SMG8 n=2 Tax=Phytophthora kernoviae TaxID=325452 RepID=A0A8T0M836_9STRA|nr:hypothetical protein G195_005096 [Phytophthora kernoviae 00238/432]KAG2529615.1 hypothetical protein JM18_001364 [Phytophthora kernoviae]KAG2531141.1 hypothetical protein JM16_001228 [Phytophthora kernoviae]
MEEFQHNRKERLREQQEEYDRREALSCGPESADDTKKTWDEVRDEFLGRMQLDLQYREMSRAAIWEEIQHECSFSPSISRRAQQLELGDFDERLRRDLDDRRLRQEQFAARMEAARAREHDFHHRPVSTKSNHLAPSTSFQERLRQDLEKRRARGAKAAKGRAPTRRQSIAEDIEQTPQTEAQRLREEMDSFEREKLKMQALLYSSCNMLFVLREDARVTTTVLKEVRALAVEKTQLLSSVTSSAKHSKRDGGHSKGSSSLSTGSGNAFAPGRCVPLVMYVVPAPDEIWDATLKMQGSTGQARSATVAYCKALEGRLTTLFRSLRGSTVGSVRMRDALSAANLSKERRVFNMDPAHSVAVVSRRTATSDGRAEAQLEDLLDALDAEISIDDILADDSLLQPLEDDDNGFQRIHQYLQKYLNLLFVGTGGSNKDGGRTELLTPSQWLKGFHALAKANRQ